MPDERPHLREATQAVVDELYSWDLIRPDGAWPVLGDPFRFAEHVADSVMDVLGYDELVVELERWRLGSMAPDESSALSDENRKALIEVDRLRGALGAFAGFLTALRDDDSEYDFTLAQYEHIGRLCQLAFHALTRPTQEQNNDR